MRRGERIRSEKSSAKMGAGSDGRAGAGHAGQAGSSRHRLRFSRCDARLLPLLARRRQLQSVLAREWPTGSMVFWVGVFLAVMLLAGILTA